MCTRSSWIILIKSQNATHFSLIFSMHTYLCSRFFKMLVRNYVYNNYWFTFKNRWLLTCSPSSLVNRLSYVNYLIYQNLRIQFAWISSHEFNEQQLITLFPEQVSMFSLLIEENENLKVLRSLRTLRALRPLRAISRWQGMRVNIAQTKKSTYESPFETRTTQYANAVVAYHWEDFSSRLADRSERVDVCDT